MFTRYLVLVALVVSFAPAQKYSGTSEDNEEALTLISNDNEKFTIDREFAQLSKLVKNILEGDSTAREIRLEQVDGGSLRKIGQYLRHRKGKPPAEIVRPYQSDKLEKIVEDIWAINFIHEPPQGPLYNLIFAAKYMEIKPLVDLGIAKVFTLIKCGKMPVLGRFKSIEEFEELLDKLSIEEFWEKIDEMLGKGRRLFITV